MKTPGEIAHRRARIARVNAKRPPDEVVITMDVVEAEDPELLRKFAGWLDRLLNESATPEQGHG